MIFLSLLSHSTQDHLTGHGPANSGLGPATLIIKQENAFRPIFWSHFLH